MRRAGGVPGHLPWPLLPVLLWCHCDGGGHGLAALAPSAPGLNLKSPYHGARFGVCLLRWVSCHHFAEEEAEAPRAPWTPQDLGSACGKAQVLWTQQSRTVFPIVLVSAAGNFFSQCVHWSLTLGLQCGWEVGAVGGGGAWVPAHCARRPAPGLLLPEGSLPSQRCRMLWALSLHTAPCPPLAFSGLHPISGPRAPHWSGLGLRAVAATAHVV